MRNANDAISMIQTADGALGVIDGKAHPHEGTGRTGGHGYLQLRPASDHRLRISGHGLGKSPVSPTPPDFNGIYLLNGNLSGSTHSGSGLVSTGKLKVHFGSGNDSAEDYYYVKIDNSTASALGVGSGAGAVAGASISTQSAAQAALDGIKNAIVSKDKIRASLGAIQNRLENTISNLQIQSENLQAAESRISDVDVSLEMTNFVRKPDHVAVGRVHAGAGQLAAQDGSDPAGGGRRRAVTGRWPANRNNRIQCASMACSHARRATSHS